MYRVLIVDDDTASRLQLQRMKIWGDASGFEIVDEAVDGAEALRKIKGTTYDLVISDIRMPKVDGMELLVKISECEVKPLFVLASEHSDFRYAKQGMVYGATGYLLKPILPEDVVELLARVKEQLDERNSGSGALLLEKANRKIDRQHVVDLVVLGSGDHDRVARDFAVSVCASFEGRPDKAVELMAASVQEAVDALVVKCPWLDSFISIEQFAFRPQEREAALLVDLYCAGIANLLSSVERFRCIDKQGPVVKQVTRYILRHIDRKLSAHSVAAGVFLNRSYLCQLFKEKTDMTVGEYITKYKMERSKRLIAQGRVKCAELAQLLGYGDAA